MRYFVVRYVRTLSEIIQNLAYSKSLLFYNFILVLLTDECVRHYTGKLYFINTIVLKCRGQGFRYDVIVVAKSARCSSGGPSISPS